MNSSRIVVNNVSKKIAHHPIVDNLNFELHTGEIVGLLGLNGAGKTTTLNLLAGLLKPSTGDIQFNHTPCIGYLPAKPALLDDFTVDEQLAYVAAIFQLSKPDTKQRIVTVKQSCDLESLSSQVIATLSKGQRQRLGIAQALLPDPNILLLDEPAEGLDPLQLNAFHALLNTLKDNKIIVYSGHAINDLQTLCQRVLILNKGVLLADTTIQHIENEHNSLIEYFNQMVSSVQT